jgi:hypothetical protein
MVARLSQNWYGMLPQFGKPSEEESRIPFGLCT